MSEEGSDNRAQVQQLRAVELESTPLAASASTSAAKKCPTVLAAFLPSAAIEGWQPEDAVYWEETGRPIARRNLWISIPCLLLAYCVWVVWSAVVVKMNSVGHSLNTDQLFWLTGLPSLSGATLRFLYMFLPPKTGGRLWTTLSTASLLIPMLCIAKAVQDTSTTYGTFIVLSLLCGLGGANFASSMVNISFFFPKAEKGNALALNAGFGNLGASVVQFVVPLVIKSSMFGEEPQGPFKAKDGVTSTLWLQNATYIFVPFIAAFSVLAWVGMDDLSSMKSTFPEQRVIFRRLHTWTMCWLYTGTFGSFIGFSSALPLLSKVLFPKVDPLKYAFLGPLIGSISRALAGAPSDRFGGARITIIVFFGLILAVLGILLSMSIKSHGLFLASFLFLFAVSGVGNASTYQMVPVITRIEVPRLNPGLQGLALAKQIAIEASTTLGVCSAFGAYGGFLVPKLFGLSISSWGGAEAALYALIGFYVSCILLTWWFFTRSSSILYAVEHGLTPEEAAAAAAGKGWWYELCGSWFSWDGRERRQADTGKGKGEAAAVEFTALAVVDAEVETGTDNKITEGR